MNSQTLILLSSATVLAAAAYVLWLGYRGRLVGDHPYCRRCGFDLFGRPPDGVRCPECGAEIGTAGAVRIGYRQRRGKLLMLGAVLALPPALWLAVSVASAVGGVAIHKYKPTFLLVWETNLGEQSARSAIEELSRRISANALTNEQGLELVKVFLSDQADLSDPWLPAKGDFLEQARLAGYVSDSDWQRYVEQALFPAMKVRPHVRHEGPIPVLVDYQALRAGTPSDRLPTSHWYVGPGRAGPEFRRLRTRIDSAGEGPAPVSVGRLHTLRAST